MFQQSRIRILSLITAMLCFVASVSGQPSITKPMETEEQKFEGLQKKTLQASYNMSGYGAPDMSKKISAVQEDFENLYKKVQQAEHIDDVIDDVDASITRMAQVYSEIALMEIDVTQHFNRELATLESTKTTTVSIVDDVDSDIAYAKRSIAELEKMAQSETSPIEQRKREVSIAGYRSRINSLQERKAIWVNFNEHQAKLLKLQRNSRDDISLLFHTIRTMSEVYKEAATTIKVRKLAKDALVSLTGLPDVGALLANIQNTQLTVDEIVHRVGSAKFKTSTEKQARPGM